MYKYEKPLIIIIDQGLGLADKIKRILYKNDFNYMLVSDIEFITYLIKKYEIPYLIIMESNVKSDIVIMKDIKDVRSDVRFIISGKNKMIDSYNWLNNGATSYLHEDEIIKYPEQLIYSIKNIFDLNKQNKTMLHNLDNILKVIPVNLKNFMKIA